MCRLTHLIAVSVRLIVDVILKARRGQCSGACGSDNTGRHTVHCTGCSSSGAGGGHVSVVRSTVSGCS